MKNLAIFASGQGSNADKICEYFKAHGDISVDVIVSNKENAGVKTVAMSHHIPFVYHPNASFHEGEEILETLREYRIDYVILAGFLRKIPTALIKAYARRIINIHPALLPKYGGKGMYGRHVHEAVKANHETESGITIHFVNHEYDKGQIIFQTSCEISETDSAERIAEKVLALEHSYYPKVIESVASSDRDITRF